MLTTWNSLEPTEQAAAVGLVVAALFYLARLARPAWFANCAEVARWRRMATSILTCGAGVAANQLGTDTWHGWAGFLLAWAAAYGTAEATHTLTARTTGAIKSKVGAAAESFLASCTWG